MPSVLVLFVLSISIARHRHRNTNINVYMIEKIMEKKENVFFRSSVLIESSERAYQ